MIGRTIGRYRIVAKLGEGGMGSVWRAEDSLLARSVALKFLSAEFAESPEARARFLREAQAACRLDHPGIETVYDVGESDGSVFIALRLIDGETVADRIARGGPLRLAEAVAIASAAADALDHAHSRGILHRDISSRNLMLSRDGQVIVVDFGLALTEGASRMTRTGATMGTAAYMAPEVVEGHAADRRSEVYSLGAVLSEMLTGDLPFRADRLAAMLFAIVHQDAPPPSRQRPNVPAALDAVVLRALAKQPAKRQQDMRELIDELEAVRGSLPVETESPVAFDRPRRPATPRPALDTATPTASLERAVVDEAIAGEGSRRRRLWVVGGALMVLGVGGALAVWIAGVGRSGTAPGSYKTVAVLPFRNVSANPAATAYLADGLSESVITKLTQVSALHVTPWMTSRRFRDTDTPVTAIVEELRVDALVVGTFQQEGDRLRGTVSLVDARSGFQVWADDFQDSMADLFALQNRIAVGVATKLLGTLTGAQVESLATPAAASVDAYDAYLKGVAAMHKGDPDSATAALGFFERAIEKDPGLADAHVGIGTVHVDRYFFGWEGGIENLDEAEKRFQKALEVEPGSIAARRGMIRVLFERGKCEDVLKQGKLVAGSGDEDVEAIFARAEAYLFGCLPHKAMPLLKRIIDLDPGNPGAYWLLTVAGAWAGRFQDAIDAGETYLKRFGEDPEIHLWVGLAYHGVGKAKPAEAHFDAAVRLGTEPPRYLQVFAAIFFRQAGQVDKADQILLDGLDALEERVEGSPDNPRLRVTLANYYGLLGDANRRREEEARILRDMDDTTEPLLELAVTAGALGERSHFIELGRRGLRSGFPQPVLFLRAFLLPDVESWPGYKDLEADYRAEIRRLEALY